MQHGTITDRDIKTNRSEKWKKIREGLVCSNKEPFKLVQGRMCFTNCCDPITEISVLFGVSCRKS